MATAREITVLADHTKFDRIRTIRVIPMSRVSRVVTDPGLAADQRTALEQLGIAVDVA